MLHTWLGRAIVTFIILSPVLLYFGFSPSTIASSDDIAIAKEAIPKIIEPNSSQDELISEKPKQIFNYKIPKRSVIDTIKKVSQEESVDWHIVYGICIAESQGCGVSMIGDKGLSIGWYQIYYLNVCELNGNKLYCIHDKDRYDLEESTRWTAQRLKRNKWRGRHEMIRSHNGLVSNHSNDWYVARIEKLVKEIKKVARLNS